jgi:hypothetical protein
MKLTSVHSIFENKNIFHEKRTFFCTLLICGSFLTAQIQVDCNNNVSIGNTSPETGISLKIKGLTRITPGSQSTVIIDNSGYCNSAAIYGGANLGKSNNTWYLVYAYDVVETSDAREKENIRTIEEPLAKILSITGIRYDFKKESIALNSIRGTGSENERFIEEVRKNRVGFLAQDVEKVIPEVVRYDDSTDIYSIDYTKFTPFLVEAIKEQQLIIDSMKVEIANLKKQLSGESQLKSGTLLSSVPDNSELSANTLFQNVPNPFLIDTRIEYYILSDVQKAAICIYDLNGKQLRCFPIENRGYGSVTISGKDLSAGIYLYSMISDGILIDTKRMILTGN